MHIGKFTNELQVSKIRIGIHIVRWGHRCKTAKTGVTITSGGNTWCREELVSVMPQLCKQCDKASEGTTVPNPNSKTTNTQTHSHNTITQELPLERCASRDNLLKQRQHTGKETRLITRTPTTPSSLTQHLQCASQLWSGKWGHVCEPCAQDV